MGLKRLSVKKLQLAAGDYEKSAEVAELIYVCDSEPGILRERKGKGFIYKYNDKRVTDPDHLDRIRKLVIPPGWKNVWICKQHNGHLQATGFDYRSRKQYRYHAQWSALRSETKFSRLHEFGKVLPKIRQQVSKDLAQPELNQSKVLGLVLRLMDETGIRIGNELYEKENGSYGLTTLKDHHVQIEKKNTIRFLFKGKKGVMHKISLRNKRIAGIVKHCRDIPGKELFQYYDDKGEIHRIDSGMVNQYIKNISGENFTTKDFRTWTGTVRALEKIKSLELPPTQGILKKSILEVVDHVASHLGNTRMVCRKYYIHPVLLKWFESNLLHSYLKRKKLHNASSRLNAEEQILLKILEEAGSGNIILNQEQHLDKKPQTISK